MAHSQDILGAARGVASTATKPLRQVVAEIQKNLNAQKAIISTALGVDPDSTFSSLFPDISKFNGGQIAKCYNSTIGNENFNMFDNPIFGSIQAYYVSKVSISGNFFLSKL